MSLRRANGLAALLIAVFFACHEVIGALFVSGLVAGEVPWIVWLAVGIIVVHIVLSIGTMKQMIDDANRPPSEKKKRHQAKKWLTGLAVGVLAVAHAFAYFTTPAWAIIAILLDIALASHICVSAKSLAKDLRMPSNWRFAIRALAIAIGVLAGMAIIVNLICWF